MKKFFTTSLIALGIWLALVVIYNATKDADAQTPHTACDHAAENSSAYLKSNEADDCLDTAMNALVTIDFPTDANITPTAATIRSGTFFNLTSTGSLTATRVLTLPSIQKVAVFMNNTTGGQLITIDDGSANDVNVPNGSAVMIHTNGTDVRHVEFAFNNLTTSASADSAADTVAVFDSSAAAMREILLDDLGITGGGGGGGGGGTLANPDWEVIDSVTASGASVTFESFDPTLYIEYEISAIDIRFDTADGSVGMRFSDDSCSTFEQGASDYRWNFHGYNDGGSEFGAGNVDTADTEMEMSGVIDSVDADASGTGYIRIGALDNASDKMAHSRFVQWDGSAANVATVSGQGTFTGNTNNINCIQMRAQSTSVFASGTFTLRGRRINPLVGAVGLIGPMIHVVDEKSDGTNGGTATTDTWTARVLNTVKTNEIDGASCCTSNRITLPAGDYFLQAWSPFRDTTRTQIRVYDNTNSTALLIGTNASPDSGDTTVITAHVGGKFSLSAQADIEIQYIVSATIGAGDLGVALGGSLTPTIVETYTQVFIWKQDEGRGGANPDWEVIEEQTASSDATLDFFFDESLYDEIELSWYNIHAQNDSVNLGARVSTNGSTFDSGANYDTASRHMPAGGTSQDVDNNAASQIFLCGEAGAEDVGNAANEAASGHLRMYAPNETDHFVEVLHGCMFTNEGGNGTSQWGGTTYDTAGTSIKGIQVGFFGAGNLVSGRVILRGRRKSPAIGSAIPVVGAQMSATGNTSVTNNGTSTVLFGTCDFETQTGICDLANEEFVVPDGFSYASVSCGVSWDSGTDDDNFRRTQIWKNNTEAAATHMALGDNDGNGGAWDYSVTVHTGLIQTTGGDTYECRGTQNSGSTINIEPSNNTWMRIQLWP
jgi:hypothetical protein